jgi:integrase
MLKTFDSGMFLVYFYTSMQLETNTPYPTSTISHSSHSLQAQPELEPEIQAEPERHSTAKQAPRSIVPRLLKDLYRDASQREALAEYVEQLLRHLRGEALLVATLAYGLGIRLSALRAVRIRDVDISDSCIVIAGRDYVIPTTIREDLKEHLQQKVCGYEAGTSMSRRDAKVFSEEAFADLVATFDHVRNLCSDASNPLGSSATRACFDSMLRVTSWLHRRLATRKGALFSSPLELFDRGPRIVRRKHGGRLDAYYVWRTTRAVL